MCHPAFLFGPCLIIFLNNIAHHIHSCLSLHYYLAVQSKPVSYCHANHYPSTLTRHFCERRIFILTINADVVSRCHANLYLSKGLSLTLCAALYLFTNMSSISDVTCKSHKQISSAVSEPNCWAQLLLKNVRYLELGQSSYLEFISASSICNLEFSMSFKQHAPTKSLMYFFIFPWRFSVSGGYHIMSDGDPGPIRHFVWWNTKLFRLHCGSIITYHRNWAPSQYKDRLIYVWRFPC